ncbi:hypothetical protein NFI96_031734 [Prochilodus magdalenae]|nr:hypothetical protein NFI96_031734 [Prochilodus magdalenae]
MGVHALLWSVVQLVFQPFKLPFICLYRCLRALVRRSLGYMDNSQRSIPYRTMGNDRSKLSYSEDFNTEYDSTWEDDNDDCEEVQSSKPESRWSYRAYRNTYAARDMQNFRHMVPKVPCDNTDYEELKKLDSEEKLFVPNLRFYQNKMKSIPDDVSIEEFHSKWFGEHKRLEWVHSYIQWLFPIQEQGMNCDAYVLTPEEIMLFRKDDEVKDRLLKSYRLMLDFYGIELCNEETGEVCRAKNWKARFENLDRNTHNNLRITRILKCLGILGFQHYQAPLVRFFLEETLVKGKLPRVKRSVLDYFMFAVLDRSERKDLIRFAFEKFEPRDEFVWCPKRIQRRFNRAAETPETVHSESESGKSNKEASHPPKLEPHQNNQSNDVAESQDANQNLTDNKTDDSNVSDESGDLNKVPVNQGHGSEDNKDLEKSIEGDIPKTDHSESESSASNEETSPKPKLEPSLVQNGSSNVAKTTDVTQDSPDNVADIKNVPGGYQEQQADFTLPQSGMAGGNKNPGDPEKIKEEIVNKGSNGSHDPTEGPENDSENKPNVTEPQNRDEMQNQPATTTAGENMQKDDASAHTETDHENVSGKGVTSDEHSDVKMSVGGTTEVTDTGKGNSTGNSNTLEEGTGASKDIPAVQKTDGEDDGGVEDMEHTSVMNGSDDMDTVSDIQNKASEPKPSDVHMHDSDNDSPME